MKRRLFLAMLGAGLIACLVSIALGSPFHRPRYRLTDIFQTRSGVACYVYLVADGKDLGVGLRGRRGAAAINCGTP